MSKDIVEEKTIHFRGGYDYSGLIEEARKLRKRNTSAETILWNALRNKKFHNLKFRRQHQIKNCIVDFYCHELKLIIELDGGIHNLSNQRRKDNHRDNVLKQYGFHVMRIKNQEIENDLENVFFKIARKLNS